MSLNIPTLVDWWTQLWVWVTIWSHNMDVINFCLFPVKSILQQQNWSSCAMIHCIELNWMIVDIGTIMRKRQGVHFSLRVGTMYIWDPLFKLCIFSYQETWYYMVVSYMYMEIFDSHTKLTFFCIQNTSNWEKRLTSLEYVLINHLVLTKLFIEIWRVGDDKYCLTE